MIEAAERDGLLRPGGTIVEPTSGNTGHGLAIAAALKGYRCIFVMADKQSAEKQAILRAYGAEVVLCPTNVPPESPESYYSVAARLARDIPGAFKPDQYWNQENPRAHEITTGPEIWEQTDGRITHFVASVGTGGTITGAARYLRAQRPDLVVVGADPEGSVLSGDIARPYLTEGVGEDFIPGTLDPALVDRWVRVSDRDAFAMARRITREEGILAGESCGTAMVAALRGGARADRRRRRRGPRWSSSSCRTAAATTSPSSTTTSGCGPTACSRRPAAWSPCGTSSTTTTTASSFPTSWWSGRPRRVGTAIGRLQEFGISQMPVSEDREGARIGGLVGSVSETGLLARAYRDPWIVERTVGEVMDPPLPQVRENATLDEAFALLEGGAPAVLATRGERPAGVVTKLDLLEYLGHHPRLGS